MARKKPIRYIPVDGEKSTYDAYLGDDIIHVFRNEKHWIALIGGCMEVQPHRDDAVRGVRSQFNKKLKLAKGKK